MDILAAMLGFGHHLGYLNFRNGFLDLENTIIDTKNSSVALTEPMIGQFNVWQNRVGGHFVKPRWRPQCPPNPVFGHNYWNNTTYRSDFGV